MRVFSSKPATSIEFNDVESNNLAGYEERTRVLNMIRWIYILYTHSEWDRNLFGKIIHDTKITITLIK